MLTAFCAVIRKMMVSVISLHNVFELHNVVFYHYQSIQSEATFAASINLAAIKASLIQGLLVSCITSRDKASLSWTDLGQQPAR